MKEFNIFSESDWRAGYLNGSKITPEHGLINTYRRLGDPNPQHEITPKWTEDIFQSEFLTTDVKGDSAVLKVRKNKTSTTTNPYLFSYCNLNTNFFHQGLMEEVYMITIGFDWLTENNSIRETAGIRLSNKLNAFHEIRLTNESEIEIITFDGEEENIELLRGGNDSGTIFNVLSNNLNNWSLNVQLIKNQEGKYVVYTRISSPNYNTDWYESEFSKEGFEKLELIQYANVNSQELVKKDLYINNIYIGGFNNGLTYDSELLDSGSKDSTWNDININGESNINPFIEQGSNRTNVKVYYGNNIEKVMSKSVQYIDFNINHEDFGYFEFTNELEEIKGRYLKLSIAHSLTNQYQNKINSIEVKYQSKEDVNDIIDEGDQDKVTYVKEEALGFDIEKGGVINIGQSGESFYARLFIPPNAIDVNSIKDEFKMDNKVDITLERLEEEDEKTLENYITFEFSPAMKFIQPVMLEIDYSDKIFDSYQDEEGLRVAYFNTRKERLEEMETSVLRGVNKVVTYLSHFSTYCLVGKQNLYQSRSSVMISKMAKWMKLQDGVSNFHQFINHALAAGLHQSHHDISKDRDNRFISMADLNMPSVSYKVKIDRFKDFEGKSIQVMNPDVISVQIKGIEIPITTDEREFHNTKRHSCFYDLRTGYLHFKEKYKDVDVKLSKSYHEEES